MSRRQWFVLTFLDGAFFVFLAIATLQHLIGWRDAVTVVAAGGFLLRAVLTQVRFWDAVNGSSKPPPKPEEAPRA